MTEEEKKTDEKRAADKPADKVETADAKGDAVKTHAADAKRKPAAEVEAKEQPARKPRLAPKKVGTLAEAKAQNAAKADAQKADGGSRKVIIRLKAYEPAVLDKTAKEIAELMRNNGADVSGPIPLPTEKEIITILRAVHKYKDSREQFEQRTHKRLIELKFAPKKAMAAIVDRAMPAGVEVDIKV
jgi:small subunit ribosomal protein S10